MGKKLPTTIGCLQLILQYSCWLASWLLATFISRLKFNVVGVLNSCFKITSEILLLFGCLTLSGLFLWEVFQDHTLANVALAGASYKMAMVTTIVTTRHSQMTACCILSGATICLTRLD